MQETVKLNKFCTLIEADTLNTAICVSCSNNLILSTKLIATIIFKPMGYQRHQPLRQIATVAPDRLLSYRTLPSRPLIVSAPQGFKRPQQTQLMTEALVSYNNNRQNCPCTNDSVPFLKRHFHWAFHASRSYLKHPRKV